jgi:chitinase
MALYDNMARNHSSEYRYKGNVYPDSNCQPFNNPDGPVNRSNCRPNDLYRFGPTDVDYCLVTHIIFTQIRPKTDPPPGPGIGSSYGGTGPNGYHTVANGYTAANGYSASSCTPNPNPTGRDWGVCFKAYEVAPYEAADIRRFADMRDTIAAQGSTAKMILSIGGWSFGTHTFHEMAADANHRKLFIDSSIKLAVHHGFHGIDLDWEYPGTIAFIDRGQGLDPDGNPKYGSRSADAAWAAVDKPNFCTLLTEYKAAFAASSNDEVKDFTLSIAVSCNPSVVPAGYDFACIDRTVDWVGLQSYDLHGSWDSFAAGSTTFIDNVPDCCAQKLPCCVAAKDFYGQGYDGYWGPRGYFDDRFSISQAASLWVASGIPKSKIVIGLATYGRTQKLTTDNTSLGDPAQGAGWEGAYTLEAGFLSYFEILGGFPKNTWHFESAGQFRWAVNGQTFVSFDDECMLANKTEWVRQQQ